VFAAADAEFHQALQAAEKACLALAAKGDFKGLLQQLAALRGPIDRFFDQVMIMDQDPVVRGNRLALLNQAVRLYRLCGDLHLVVGNK